MWFIKCAWFYSAAALCVEEDWCSLVVEQAGTCGRIEVRGCAAEPMLECIALEGWNETLMSTVGELGHHSSREKDVD